MSTVLLPAELLTYVTCSFILNGIRDVFYGKQCLPVISHT